MKVDVYVNLNKGCISVKSRETDSYGKVVSHEPKVHLRDVEFVVQPAGRERCREEGVKNVHAYVRGEWDENIKVVQGEFVTYDPYRYDYFYWPDGGEYVEGADRAAVTKAGVYAEGLSTLGPKMKV